MTEGGGQEGPLTLQGATPPESVASADDRALLVASGLLDEAWYRVRARLSDGVDAAAHYLDRGWLQGFEPREEFEGEFLLPYYESCARTGPPVLTWLELSIMPGRRAPMNRADAEWLADRIRTSPFFDAKTYAQGLPGGLNPAIHYAVIGELLGRSPSRNFDPAFYLELHPDVADRGMSPLYHYIEYWPDRSPPAGPRHQQVGISAPARRPAANGAGPVTRGLAYWRTSARLESRPATGQLIQRRLRIDARRSTGGGIRRCLSSNRGTDGVG